MNSYNVDEKKLYMIYTILLINKILNYKFWTNKK